MGGCRRAETYKTTVSSEEDLARMSGKVCSCGSRRDEYAWIFSQKLRLVKKVS